MFKTIFGVLALGPLLASVPLTASAQGPRGGFSGQIDILGTDFHDTVDVDQGLGPDTPLRVTFDTWDNGDPDTNVSGSATAVWKPNADKPFQHGFRFQVGNPGTGATNPQLFGVLDTVITVDLRATPISPATAWDAVLPISIEGTVSTPGGFTGSATTGVGVFLLDSAGTLINRGSGSCPQLGTGTLDCSGTTLSGPGPVFNLTTTKSTGDTTDTAVEPGSTVTFTFSGVPFDVDAHGDPMATDYTVEVRTGFFANTATLDPGEQVVLDFGQTMQWDISSPQASLAISIIPVPAALLLLPGALATLSVRRHRRVTGCGRPARRLGAGQPRGSVPGSPPTWWWPVPASGQA